MAFSRERLPSAVASARTSALTRNALVRLHATLPALLALVQAACLPTAHAQADTTMAGAPCPGGAATVLGARQEDFSDVCAGVASALGFLAGHGVTPTETVTVEVTVNIPAEAGPTAAGCYIERRRRVFLVPYERFRKSKSWFGVTIDRRMYRALAAHEAAHAVGACNFRIPNPTIQAKEYLAYVTMFSVMPAELRSRALRKTEGFASLDRFTPLLYSFDPMRFGAEAYRHFAATAGQTELIRALLAGQVLLD